MLTDWRSGADWKNFFHNPGPLLEYNKKMLIRYLPPPLVTASFLHFLQKFSHEGQGLSYFSIELEKYKTLYLQGYLQLTEK